MIETIVTETSIVVGPSSFTIKKSELSERQIHKIKTHIERALKYTSKDKYKDYDFGYMEDKYAWIITETDTEISGHTDKDYFDMYQFLEAINVEESKITWTGY